MEPLCERRRAGRGAYLHLVLYFVSGLLKLANLSDNVRYLWAGGHLKAVCCLRAPRPAKPSASQNRRGTNSQA